MFIEIGPVLIKIYNYIAGWATSIINLPGRAISNIFEWVVKIISNLTIYFKKEEVKPNIYIPKPKNITLKDQIFSFKENMTTDVPNLKNRSEPRPLILNNEYEDLQISIDPELQKEIDRIWGSDKHPEDNNIPYNLDKKYVVDVIPNTVGLLIDDDIEPEMMCYPAKSIFGPVFIALLI